MTGEIMNAVIYETFLGLEDHGIPTAWLRLEYDGSTQGFGGYDLRHQAHARKFIWRVLEVVGVREWGDLVGKPCRVIAGDTWNGPLKAIGHIIKDKWYYPEKEATS